MLLNEAARDLYDEESPRWTQVEAWVTDTAHPERAAQLHQLDRYFERWHELDKGRWLSDPNDIDSTATDLEVVENYAAELGYPLPPGHGKRTATTTEIVNAGEGIHEIAGLPTTIADQQAVSDYINLSWCQEIGVPAVVCGKDGLHMPDDKTPLYLFGGGLAVLLLGGAYVSYKAAQVVAPIALRLAAPELAPSLEKFRAERAAGGSGRQHIEDMIVELAGKR